MSYENISHTLEAEGAYDRKAAEAICKKYSIIMRPNRIDGDTGIALTYEIVLHNQVIAVGSPGFIHGYLVAWETYGSED